MDLFRLSKFIDNLLEIKKIKDYSLNGLQIQNSGKIKKIYCAVDANLHTMKKCMNNSILLVHHGIIWGNPFPITGSNYEKIKTMIDKDAALYACHLPLDMHSELGNNAMLLKTLELEPTGEFGIEGSNFIGVKGDFLEKITIEETSDKLKKSICANPIIMNFSNKKLVKSVCIVSGKVGNSILEEFLESENDLLITGEASHVLHNFAEDNKLNIICAGHYATETLGIKELAKITSDKFSLDWEFIEHPTGL